MSTDCAKTERQYITFTAASQHFGLPICEVQEVLQQPNVTPVSHAPPAVEGLINLRGRIIPAIDLRRLLQLPKRDGSVIVPGVVMRTRIGAVSLQVDEIGDVLELDGRHDPLPPNSDPIILEFAVGVRRLEQRLLLILDSARIPLLGKVAPKTSEN